MNFNQPFIYPEHAKPPTWVMSRLQSFHDQLKIDSESKDFQKKTIKNLEQNIFYPKIKLPGVLTKKNISKYIHTLSESCNDIEFMWFYYLLMQAGFTLSSVNPSSFQPEALIIPDEFRKEKNEYIKIYNDSKKTTEDALNFQKNITKLAEKVKLYFDKNNISITDLMNSGAKGNISHIQSLLLGVGLSINSFGEVNDVIDNSHAEGLTQTQFFNGTSQAIQALYSKGVETSAPGFLGRKLSTIAERIKLSKSLDCKTTNYLKLKIQDSDILKSLEGRYYKTSLGEKQITPSNKELIGKTIQLRSPLYCKSLDGICHRCYNPKYIKDAKLNSGANIGLIASTGLTGNLVNLTLKKSHVGVGLDKEEVNLIEEFKKMD